MNGGRKIPPFVYQLITQLIRRGLPLGVDDCDALRRALSAGFGLTSRRHLEDLCVALWAKSAAEADVVRAMFARVDAPVWDSRESAIPPDVASIQAEAPVRQTAGALESSAPSTGAAGQAAQTEVRRTGLPLAPPRTGSHDASLVFFPQYPVTEREVAQTWRRLRRATRQGPPAELDIAATLNQYAKTGVASAPVLVPVRRNTARLVVFADRQGSMTPYHSYVDFICKAISKAGRLDAMTVAYFRNTAGRSGDHSLMHRLPDSFQPMLDPIVNLITPLTDGTVYTDAALTVPVPLSQVLEPLTATTGVVVISDGGAGRRRFNAGRLLDTIALIKAFRAARATVTWLNPVPPRQWRDSTAEQIARHLPMFALTRDGMHKAVDVLRGRPSTVDRVV